MKRLLSFSVLLFVLVSCSPIYFEEVQPKKGIRQLEMPEELFGVWFGNGEGWQLSEDGITKIDFNTDSLDNIIDTVYQTIPLSDSLRLYKTKGLYVLNYRKNSKYWEISIFHPQENGDLYFYSISDPKTIARVKGLKLESAIYDIDDELQTVKTLDPEAESFLKFESAVFSGQMKIRSLRKVLRSIPPTIFASDGTIREDE